MIAKTHAFTFMTHEGFVKVPYFQRAYVWNEKNWSELLSHLLEKNINHFIGTIVLKQIEAQSGYSKQALIIDGQQRLMTLSIMLYTIKKSLHGIYIDEPSEATRYNGCLYGKDNVYDTVEYVKIVPSKVDERYYQAIMLDDVYPDDIDYDSCENNVLKCFKYFTNKFTEIPGDDRIWLYKNLLNPKREIMVVLDLNNADSEVRVFSAVNSMGMRISPSETVKNWLYQRALDIGMDRYEVNHLYKETWERTFARDDDSVLFWNKPSSNNQIEYDNIGWLLKDIAIIKGLYTKDSRERDLLQIYEMYIKSINYERGLISFINEVTAYARIHRSKMYSFDRNALYSFNDFEKRFFHVVSTLNITVFRPYILYIYYKNTKNRKGLETDLRRLETLIFRLYASGKYPAEGQGGFKLCYEFIHDETGYEKILAATPSDEEFIRTLQNIKREGSNDSRPATLALFWLELYRRSNPESRYSCYDKDALRYIYSLEHMMPEYWEEHWRDVRIEKADGSPILEWRDKKDYRDKHIRSIGNMTLLKEVLNSNVQNQKFSIKMKGGTFHGVERYGIIHHAELGITVLDFVEPYSKNNMMVWNEKAIREREKGMIEDIVGNIWPRIEPVFDNIALDE